MSITKQEADHIFHLARELEDAGRLSSISEFEEKKRWMQRNREVQCALQDALRLLQERSFPFDMALDAARYQWLRQNKPYVVRLHDSVIHCGGHPNARGFGPALDKAVDEGMGSE